MLGSLGRAAVDPEASWFIRVQSRKDDLAAQRQNFHPFRQCFSAGHASKSCAAHDEYLRAADDEEVGRKADTAVTERPSSQRTAQSRRITPCFFSGLDHGELHEPEQQTRRISRVEQTMPEPAHRGDHTARKCANAVRTHRLITLYAASCLKPAKIRQLGRRLSPC